MKIHELAVDLEEIGKVIVNSAFKVHSVLGPGLLEKVYETCICHEIRKAGLLVDRQVDVSILYDGIQFEQGLRLDLLVESRVVVEIKALEIVNPVWAAQVLSQLKMTGNQLGYLINFNVPLIKSGIKRIIRSDIT